MFSWLDIKN